MGLVLVSIWAKGSIGTKPNLPFVLIWHVENSARKSITHSQKLLSHRRFSHLNRLQRVLYRHINPLRLYFYLMLYPSPPTYQFQLSTIGPTFFQVFLHIYASAAIWMFLSIDKSLILSARHSHFLSVFPTAQTWIGAHPRLPYTGKLRITFARYSMSSQDFVLWISSIPTIDFVFTSFFQRIPTSNGWLPETDKKQGSCPPETS